MVIEEVITQMIDAANATVTGVGAVGNRMRLTFVAALSRCTPTVVEPVGVPRVVGRLARVLEPTVHRAVLRHIIRFGPR